jgi:hypothetical protein
VAFEYTYDDFLGDNDCVAWRIVDPLRHRKLGPGGSFIVGDLSRPLNDFFVHLMRSITERVAERHCYENRVIGGIDLPR